MRWWSLMLLVLALLPGAARADDISAAARGVVRVVTIAVVDGHVVGFGHGSGFAVAPGRIVTNAHVVELASRYPDNVVIGAVPSEGSKSYRARVVALDERRDLALLQVQGGDLPAATLYIGPVGEGDAFVSLGYPGNVDLATAQSAADYIRPTSPVRTEGGFSGTRQLGGVEVLLHTASIARGNSGGPLLDRCGRVVGVNSAITRGEEGDANFGFAIADAELAGFLRDAGQPFRAVTSACTDIGERLRADEAADAASAASAQATRRERAAGESLAREQARERARVAGERARENVMAIAALLLVGGALALGAGGTAIALGRRAVAGWAAAAGLAGMVAAVLVFINRPFDVAPSPAVVVAASEAPDPALGGLRCVFRPGRSRVTVSAPGDVALDWGRGGCADGQAQYVARGGRWTRVSVSASEDALSVRRFDPATRTLDDTRYLLAADTLARARQALGAERVCTTDARALAALANRQAAVRASLPALPNEKLSYACGGQ